MAAVNSRYNSSTGVDDSIDGGYSYGTATKRTNVPNIVDWNAFASSGKTLAVANKPPALGDRVITLPNIPTEVDWAQTKNEGPSLAIKNKPSIRFYDLPSNPFTNLGGYPNAEYIQTGALDVRDYISAPKLSVTNQIQTSDPDNLQDWNGNPLFKTVAKTGNYSDLSGKPTIPSFPSNVVAANSGAQTQVVPLVNGQLFTGTWGTPTYATITDWNRSDVISYAIFYQAFYNNQTGRPVTLPAGYFNLTVPSQQAFRMCGWDFVDGNRYLADVTDFNKSVKVSGNKYGYNTPGVNTNVSYGFGSGDNADQTNTLCRPYPGFVQNAYTTPLYSNSNLYFSSVNGGTLSATSASVTLPAGISEFRFAAWPSMTSVQNNYVPTPSFTIDNFFVMSPFYSIVDNSIPAVKSLIVQQPKTWSYYYNAPYVNGPQSTYTLSSASWTLVSPSSTASIMSASDGKLTIPQTGIYAVTLSSGWNNAVATANHRMISNDPSLGLIAGQLMFAETFDLSKTDQLDTSMTTRLAGGTTLTPVFNFGTSATLYGSGSTTYGLTRIIITLIYACA